MHAVNEKEMIRFWIKLTGDVLLQESRRRRFQSDVAGRLLSSSPVLPGSNIAVVFMLICLGLFITSCSKPERQPGGPAAAHVAANSDAGAEKRQVPKATLAGGSYSVLAPEVLAAEANEPAIKALRNRGLLKVAAPCDREALCTRMKYGVAVGFEAELLRKLSNEVIGVKENIVAENDADADVRAGVTCGAPGMPPIPSDARTGKIFTGPYYYSKNTGWLCFEVLKGGRPLARALDTIVAHFYRTGTLQQIYKNWFPPPAGDAI
jgi:ABC-type amino acid transport substrate-binding protein